MSNLRIHLAVCATVLLMTCMNSAESAGIQDCLAGIKGLFCVDKSYATLADHLYKATESKELADNIREAQSLLIENLEIKKKEPTIKLVQAFTSLKSDMKHQESFCSNENIANLVRVVEGLRDGGNLGPKMITPAILRLNEIVITLMLDINNACYQFLGRKWPNPWNPNFSDPAMRARIFTLSKANLSYLYQGFYGVTKNFKRFEAARQSYSFSSLIRKSEQDSAHPIDPNERNPLTTLNTTVIGMQLDEYVYKPCIEFVRLDEAEEVLVPYNEFIKSSYVFSSSALQNYYENKKALKILYKCLYPETEVRALAHSYQACKRFLATPKAKLAKRISEFRFDEDEEEDEL